MAAETIGLASGIVALATFAFQASLTLHSTIQSFQSHPKRVRDLIDELGALSGVLGPLSERLNSSKDWDFSSLDLPLLRCGNACKEFQQELLKCSSRSSGDRTSFRDWAKLRYMGDDIDVFRRSLASYKLTISIALTDASLSRGSILAESLDQHSRLIVTAKDDLQDRLETIDAKLESILQRAVTDSSSPSIELNLMQAERLSTQRCLQICDQLAAHISQLQTVPRHHANDSRAPERGSAPEIFVNEGLQDCQNSLLSTVAKLEGHMEDVMRRIVKKSKNTTASADDVADLVRLQEEWTTTRQSINICAKAGDHLKESVSVIENYATGDAVQFMVSTKGKTIHGKNQGHGWRTRQVGGHLDDETLVHISHDMSSPGVVVAEYNPGSLRDHADDTGKSKLWARHGPGVSLK